MNSDNRRLHNFHFDSKSENIKKTLTKEDSLDDNSTEGVLK